MALVNVSHLTFSYPLSTTSAIEDISFSVEKGEFIAYKTAASSAKNIAFFCEFLIMSP